jgi:ammonium transporter, Amt family
MHNVRPARFLIFISIWSVVVYDPVARWSWDPEGWSNKLGAMDFAGGTPVHIVSGTTVAAFAIFCSVERNNSFDDLVRASRGFVRKLRKRIVRPWVEIWRTLVICIACCFRKSIEDRDSHSEDEEEEEERGLPFEPYSLNYLVLGTALLWFGWAGFNGGSALGGNLRAVSAWTSTHIAASTGGTVGVLVIWYTKTLAWLSDDDRHEHAFDNLTVIYFCDGAVAGLVAITPASGYVTTLILTTCECGLTVPGPCLERCYFRCHSSVVCTMAEKGDFYLSQRRPFTDFCCPHWRWIYRDASDWPFS